MEWFWWMWWPEVRQSIQTCTSKPSKKWNSVSGECSLTGILETCWLSTTMSALTQVYEPRRQLPNLVGLCSPIPLKSWSGTVRFSSFWATEGCKGCTVGQGLKMFVQWWRGYMNRKRAGTGKACMPLFHAGVTCVKETSSYTVCEFHTFWINSFWEKNLGHYFLSNLHSLPTQHPDFCNRDVMLWMR
jgi:hypothetical protein